jgi:putative membrane protein
MASTSENLLLEKRLNIAAWVVTGAVLLLVGLMRRVKIPLPEGVNVDFLPPFHATMNACTAIVLLLAYYFILEKKVEAHRKAIYVAVVLSVLFLLSYVAYHFTTPETIYGDIDKDGMLSEVERSAAGTGRTVYLVVLLSHIVLAGLSLPFILFTFIRAYTNQFDRHRKMARWVWPVWLYVAVTGPICYFMLLPYY